MLLAWMKDLRPWINASQPWITKAGDWDSYAVTRQPNALWPLDDAHRGDNLGVLGRQFNLKIENVKWTDVGPLGKKAGNYVRLGNMTNISVLAHHDGKKLLDLSKPFTITVWVKTDDMVIRMPILETYGKNYARNFHFWFYESQYQDQLYINNPRYVYTTINKTDRLKWRHIACRHHGESKFSFYLNGKKWPIIQEGKKPSPTKEIEIIYIGSQRNEYFFYGNMACFMIFGEALTTDEIKNVRTMCG